MNLATIGWTEIANITLALVTLISVLVNLISNNKKHKKLTANLLKKKEDEINKEIALNQKFDAISKQVTQCQTKHNQDASKEYNRLERELELKEKENKAANDKLADAIINLKKEMTLKFEGMSQSMDDLKSTILSILEHLGHPPVIVPATSKAKSKQKTIRKN